MSNPTRGMVAGQAITTQAQTKEFDEGYERVFGAVRKPCRGRFVYRDGQAVNVDEDWTDAERRAQTSTEELTYGGAVATDGTPINSRKKHAEYLKREGLCMAGDFSDNWRANYHASEDRKETKQLREIVDRSVHKVFGG